MLAVGGLVAEEEITRAVAEFLRGRRDPGAEAAKVAAIASLNSRLLSVGVTKYESQFCLSVDRCVELAEEVMRRMQPLVFPSPQPNAYEFQAQGVVKHFLQAEHAKDRPQIAPQWAPADWWFSVADPRCFPQTHRVAVTRPETGTIIFTIQANYENGRFSAHASRAEVANPHGDDTLEFPAEVSEAAVRLVLEMLDSAGGLYAERQAWMKTPNA